MEAIFQGVAEQKQGVDKLDSVVAVRLDGECVIVVWGSVVALLFVVDFAVVDVDVENYCYRYDYYYYYYRCCYCCCSSH